MRRRRNSSNQQASTPSRLTVDAASDAGIRWIPSPRISLLLLLGSLLFAATACETLQSGLKLVCAAHQQPTPEIPCIYSPSET